MVEYECAVRGESKQKIISMEEKDGKMSPLVCSEIEVDIDRGILDVIKNVLEEKKGVELIDNFKDVASY